jgi:hypothetical protein
MTKKEFWEMTGLVVDEEQMWGIHKAHLASGLENQKFQKSLIYLFDISR